MENNHNIYVHYFRKPAASISLSIYPCDPDDIGPIDRNCSTDLMLTFVLKDWEIDHDFMLVHLN